ncbi:sugar phosphate isomerase/epimerase family protein [Subtercola sp. YIM 133946]|uniref:sugar phosphate isomerase/epimerase family protein n=1 Tax=Subtercola sp. YIM 133946 TaxID=3118909 RepID=UPI002F94B000
MTWQKWSYMDHWVLDTPQGGQNPYFNRRYLEQYIRQLAALGFRGFDTFFFYLPMAAQLFGSVKKFEEFLQDEGFDKITGIFSAYPNATKFTAPHVRSTHDRIFADSERIVEMVDGLAVENLIVMPTNTYFQVAPITDEKIKITADLWNRVGEMSISHGLKLSCHFEFWGGIRTPEELALFFEYTDPRYVFYFCDTAQHTIAGVDPLELFRTYRERCSGFHFKDTHTIDRDEAYRTPPDAELMAPNVSRWFHEMGTPEGLVDFPSLMKEIVSSGFDGWLTVEHDQAEVGGNNYAEATSVAKWYIDNVLEKVEADR